VTESIGAAIEAGDLDELLRIIDTLCDTREWDQLVQLRDRARRALERGRQLWPAASHAEYRLALEAPAEIAATMLVEDAARFALGPVAEVAASTHTWHDLAAFAPAGPVASVAAHERVVRGETVESSSVSHAEVLSVPLALEPWEPEYAVAVYRADRVEVAAPQLPRGRALGPAVDAVEVDDPEVVAAARDLVRAWTAGSEGRARVVAVEGDTRAAIGALGVRDVRGAWLDTGEAVALLAWAAASGGAHGRRRGAAAGRDLTWSFLRAVLLLDVDDHPAWDAVTRLRWLAWNAPDASTGWMLRFAVEDPDAGLAWAVDAVDPPRGS
jgi:hypothetical protein